MKNISRACICSSGIPVGACASVSKAPVSSGNEFQVVHMAFFAWPTNADTVSYPVSGWNILDGQVISQVPNRKTFCALPARSK